MLIMIALTFVSPMIWMDRASAMENRFGRDLTTGSIPTHLLNFSIPMLVGNMLQSGYSIINMIWVGNIVGENGLGAAAVSFPIMFILIGIGAGLTMATSVLVAQFYGAKNYDKMKKVIDNSISLGIVISLLSGCSRNPVEQFPVAHDEHAGGHFRDVRKLSADIARRRHPAVLMFTISSILRGIGDTVTPLMFMGGGVVLNAILDPLMIMGIGPFPRMGLNGAAWASVVSQGISLSFALIYLNRKNHLVAIKLKKPTFDKHITWLLCKIGFPATVQQSLVSIGQAFVTTYVNHLWRIGNCGLWRGRKNRHGGHDACHRNRNGGDGSYRTKSRRQETRARERNF